MVYKTHNLEVCHTITDQYKDVCEKLLNNIRKSFWFKIKHIFCK